MARVAVLLHASFSSQLFSLLMVTDHQHGGYNMDDNEIGVMFSIVAVVQLFFQVGWCGWHGF